ncbi:beta strand repeat-containing protein [Pedosphaera parvula]|uniref:Autotransporter-associated beta strand repeat protein n=1 Tax=Pedosphaera parvula (strain Ellin514) TaxID=320771 RepID=B9XR15_PEDPL|nr:autotransporter-associated beta strand repeat protein [Pedosphaera parvula]EEF57711.1 autotransporter-associated beta strand repeat protein [Pedosphaera parvula Ellin514]
MKHFLSTALFATIFSAVSSLQAAPLYWDPSASTGTTLGGTGNWDEVGNFWYNGTADIIWASANGDDAYFTGTAGTVTLTSSITAGNLYFTNATGSYVLTNATGAEVLTVAGAIDTGGGEHIIGAPIVNSSTLNKNGGGRLHLPVDNGATLFGAVMINQGDVSVENNNGAGQSTSITVADGAALVLNGGTSGLTSFNPNVTIYGSGITNSGALRNLSGVTTFNGQIILGANNSVIYADSGSSLVYNGTTPLTDNGNNYNLIINASGSGNVHLGQISIGGSLILKGPGSCYSYLNSITPSAWKSTYISQGGTLYVENNNGFGTQPATLMTTNVLLDGGTINSIGTYTMYATDGITVTTNGGTLTVASGTLTSCNIYSQSNASFTIGGAGSSRPGGAAGITAGTINLGTGALIKTGGGDCNLGYANPSLEIYSNLVVNGGSISFNYDVTSGQVTSLGAVPSTLNASNIVLNGGQLHVGHTTTIGAMRGIYVGSGGGTIEDVTSGGTVTVASPIIGPGSMNFPLGKSGSTTAVTLTGNNSYAGTTTVGASSTLNIGSGGSTGTLGAGNTTDNGTLVFNRTGSYSYGGVISGSGTVTKNAAGTVTLTGASTFTGNTTVNAGMLLINNTSGSGTGTGTVTVQNNATLGGTGSIGGAVTVNAGGTLAPGTANSPLGKLTINNSLTLAGNLAVSVNRTVPTNSLVTVTGALANTGTGNKVTVTNLGPVLVAGDKFYVFNQPISGGDTLQITGASGVTWSNNLAVDGSIVVVAPAPNPVINSFSLSSTNLVMSGTNGYANGAFYLLSTTNVGLPLSSWSRVLTNTFDGTGNFSVTNQQTTNSQRYYMLQLP